MTRRKKQRTQDEQQALDVEASNAHDHMTNRGLMVAGALLMLREYEASFKEAADAYDSALVASE